VSNDDFSDDDPRWAAQVRVLVDQLNREAGDVRYDASKHTGDGKKGAAATVILALGTAGAFTAAVQVIKAFLQRDTKRKLELRRLGPNGEVETLVFETEGLSTPQVERLIEAHWPSSNG